VYHKTLEYFYKDYKKVGKWWSKKELTDKFASLLSREMLTPLEKDRLEKKGIE
jgi:hypothetical protein